MSKEIKTLDDLLSHPRFARVLESGKEYEIVSINYQTRGVGLAVESTRDPFFTFNKIQFLTPLTYKDGTKVAIGDIFDFDGMRLVIGYGWYRDHWIITTAENGDMRNSYNYGQDRIDYISSPSSKSDLVTVKISRKLAEKLRLTIIEE